MEHCCPTFVFGFVCVFCFGCVVFCVFVFLLCFFLVVSFALLFLVYGQLPGLCKGPLLSFVAIQCDGVA